MRWQRGQRSSDLEDRRGGGAGGGRGRPGVRLGLGGTLVLLVLSVGFGRNLFSDLGVEPGVGDRAPSARAPSPGSTNRTRRADPREEELVDFVSFVLDDVQDTWTRIYQKSGKRYPRAKLVLFTDSVRSACGIQGSATGPFYCPGDNKAYIDLGFYQQLKTRFGAPGDFAQAYVLAHEIGHHIQNVSGMNRKVREAQRRNPRKKNELQVRMELQADCYAGVWAPSTNRRNILEAGDVEEGLRAVAAIGDDTLQKQAGQRVRPESWTHGSSAMRMRWFSKGFKTGDVSACDSFSASKL